MQEELRGVLAGALDGVPAKQAGRAVDRLITHYRGRTPTDAPVLRDRADVAAYAAYRMPATFEAVRSALEALEAQVPLWAPASHVDVGGGTGAATWAAASVWPDLRTTVLDWAEPALALGAELARHRLPETRWQRQVIGDGLVIPEDTDLVTVSYVLGELTEANRAAVVSEAARATTVVLIEPGTPEGYLRIREARDQLIAAGLRVVAPCPHSATCPIVAGADWCHFSARVNRSSLHRQVKGGSLPYEDEKFAYVAATRLDARPAASRVTRKPQLRKGQVLLDVCTPEDGFQRRTITKRHGSVYRTARNVDWGDPAPDGTS